MKHDLDKTETGLENKWDHEGSEWEDWYQEGHGQMGGAPLMTGLGWRD